MPDTVTHIHGALVQHGGLNDRIYVMHLDPHRAAALVATLEDLARKRRYGKILAKVPDAAWPVFASAGYVMEAVVPGFFRGAARAVFAAKYPSPRRRQDPRARQIRERLSAWATRPPRFHRHGPATAIEYCGPTDAEAMGALYRQVFRSYPFPIYDPDFLRSQMAAGVRYFGIRRRSRLVALASAEIDQVARAAEMTDFATLKPWRGRGLASDLLAHLDRVAAGDGIVTGYTIARAGSPGMNCVFYRQCYRYGGYLPNNTQIGGRIESMVVWHKRLSAGA